MVPLGNQGEVILAMPRLSVVVPVYNEAGTIAQILEKVNSVPIDKEIIVVNDGSADGTERILRDLAYPNLKVIHHTSNRGKGSAVTTGIAHAQGEFIIIQDADLEYDPADYLRLLEEIGKEGADIVLGARFSKGYHGLFIPRLGNRLLTGIFNILFGTRLNDSFTCYKVFRRDTISSFGLASRSFDIEIEIIAKAIKHKLKIKEIPVSYYPRGYSQGKKIRILDGLRAVYSIIKFRLMMRWC
jgi:glycosyltransferase involved in cell wall biosynthesis